MQDMLSLIRSRRSIRRFEQRPIARETLLDLIEAARYAPSAANRQPVEYVIVDEPHLRAGLFELLAWAAHVRPRRTPGPEYRPVAYIMVLRCTAREFGSGTGRRGRGDPDDAPGRLVAGNRLMLDRLRGSPAGAGTAGRARLARDRLGRRAGLPGRTTGRRGRPAAGHRLLPGRRGRSPRAQATPARAVARQWLYYPVGPVNPGSFRSAMHGPSISA